MKNSLAVVAIFVFTTTACLTADISGTWETTVERAKRCDPDVFLTTVACPVNGTLYFDQVASRVVSPRAWAEGFDRDCRIRGRYVRDFYQYADALLRHEVQLHQLQSGHHQSPDPSRLDDLHAKIAQAREGLRASNAEVES